MTSDERHFLFRKLHSLLGIVPVGLFLFLHLYHNAFALRGREAYGRITAEIQGIPYLIFFEATLIWLPILLHAGYGFYVMFTGSNNTRHYGHMGNWVYVMQRITGAILFFFILFHVITTWGTRARGVAMYDVMEDTLGGTTLFAFYILGTASAVFHFCTGLWTFGISWGITVGPRSQRVAGLAFFVMGVLLFIVGLNSLLAFRGEAFGFGGRG